MPCPRGIGPCPITGTTAISKNFAFIFSEFIKLPIFMNRNWNRINSNRLAAKMLKIFSSYAKGWCWGWGCTTGIGLCLGPFCFTIRATKRGRWVNRTVWTVSQSPNDALSQGNFLGRLSLKDLLKKLASTSSRLSFREKALKKRASTLGRSWKCLCRS